MATFISITVLTRVFTSISLYTQGREVTRLLSQDAKSAWNWIKDCWPKTKPSLAAQSANTPSSTTIWTLGSRLSNVNVAALFTSVGIAVEIYKAYQGDQIDKELKNITKGITISNNLQAQGSGGPDGFARHVRDFVNLKIEQYSQDGGKHRFFVYHPDTQWHGAFMRLMKEDGPLDESFCALSTDLFALCRWMLCMRVEFLERSKKEKDEVTFHVLIPTYQSLVIALSFVLLEALHPLTFDGEIANGERLVWLNMPREGPDTLRDVGNLYRPCERPWQREAAGSATLLAVEGGGSVFVTAAASVCPGLLFLPAMAVMGYATATVCSLAVNKVDALWKEEPPAWLG